MLTVAERILSTDEIKALVGSGYKADYSDSRIIGEDHFDRWIEGHDEGQRIKGIRGLLDYRPLPRDVRRYIEVYLEAAAEEAGQARMNVRPDEEGGT